MSSYETPTITRLGSVSELTMVKSTGTPPGNHNGKPYSGGQDKWSSTPHTDSVLSGS